MPGTPKSPDAIHLEPVRLPGIGLDCNWQLRELLRANPTLATRHPELFGLLPGLPNAPKPGGDAPAGPVPWNVAMPPSEGLVAWQKTVSIVGVPLNVVDQSLPVPGLVPALEIGGGYTCTETPGQDRFAPVALLSDRISFRLLLTNGGTSGTPWGIHTTLEFEVWAGFGCLGKKVWSGVFDPKTIAVPPTGAVADLVQISGHLADRWTFWCRGLTSDSQAVGLKMNFDLNFQIDRHGPPWQIKWPDDGTVTKVYPAGAPLSNVNLLP